MRSKGHEVKKQGAMIEDSLENRITFCVYLLPDDFGARASPAHQGFMRKELSRFLETVEKFERAFQGLKLKMPTYYFQYVFLPLGWGSSVSERGSNKLFDESRIDDRSSSSEFFEILSELREGRALERIVLEEVFVDPLHYGYFNCANHSNGNLLDYFKFKALAYLGESHSMNHLQMDVNTVIPNYLDFVRTTFGQDPASAKEQFLVGIYSKSNPHYTINNKVIYIPNTSHSQFRWQLQNSFNTRLIEYQPDESSPVVKLDLFNNAYKDALRNFPASEDTGARRHSTEEKQLSCLDQANFVNFSDSTMPYFGLSGRVLVEVRQDWNSRTIEYLRKHKMPQREEARRHGSSLIIQESKRITHCGFYDAGSKKLHLQVISDSDADSIIKLVRYEYPSGVKMDTPAPLSDNIAKKIKNYFNLSDPGIDDPMNELKLDENHGMFTYVVENMTLFDGSQTLDCVDNSSSEALRPVTCSRDSEILSNAKAYCTEIDPAGSREQVAGCRDMRCKTLDCEINIYTIENLLYKWMTPPPRQFVEALCPIYEFEVIKTYIETFPESRAFILNLVNYIHSSRENKYSNQIKAKFMQLLSDSDSVNTAGSHSFFDFLRKQPGEGVGREHERRAGREHGRAAGRGPGRRTDWEHERRAGREHGRGAGRGPERRAGREPEEHAEREPGRHAGGGPGRRF